jgi:hypothetical protein
MPVLAQFRKLVLKIFGYFKQEADSEFFGYFRQEVDSRWACKLVAVSLSLSAWPHHLM